MIAAKRVKDPGLLDTLRRWAEQKYSLPWTHEAIQSQTIFELLITFWEDHFSEHKIESHRNEKGEIVLETGDPLIDKWEQELAQGLEPDLLEGMTEEQKEHIVGKKPVSNEAEDLVKQIEEEGGFTDDYSSHLAGLPILGKSDLGFGDA